MSYSQGKESTSASSSNSNQTEPWTDYVVTQHGLQTPSMVIASSLMISHNKEEPVQADRWPVDATDENGHRRHKVMVARFPSAGSTEFRPWLSPTGPYFESLLPPDDEMQANSLHRSGGKKPLSRMKAGTSLIDRINEKAINDLFSGAGTATQVTAEPVAVVWLDLDGIERRLERHLTLTLVPYDTYMNQASDCQAKVDDGQKSGGAPPADPDADYPAQDPYADHSLDELFWGKKD